MFVFVYSSYHLKLSFLHLVVILTTLETPKNIFWFNNFNIMQNDNAAGIHGHYHESSDLHWITRKIPTEIKPPKKNTCQIFLPKKIPESKISNPQKSFDHPRHLKSGVPSPPPPPWVCRSLKRRDVHESQNDTNGNWNNYFFYFYIITSTMEGIQQKQVFDKTQTKAPSTWARCDHLVIWKGLHMQEFVWLKFKVGSTHGTMIF